MSEKEIEKSLELLWMLNELTSPYRYCKQRIASYFLRGSYVKSQKLGRSAIKPSARLFKGAQFFFHEEDDA